MRTCHLHDYSMSIYMVRPDTIMMSHSAAELKRGEAKPWRRHLCDCSTGIDFQLEMIKLKSA
jgi:hypothetical protein